MSDTKISALAAAPTLSGTEEFPINQGGVSRKATAAQIRALANTLAEPVAINAPATLNQDHYGKILHVKTAGTITLPPAPSTTEVLRILNGSAPAGNVTASIGDTGAEVKVGPGKDVTFLSISSGWVRMQPAVEAGGSTSAPFLKGRYYPISASARVVSSGSPTTAANTIYFQAFLLPADANVSALAAQITTAGVAGSTGMLAIYAANTNTMQPTGAPILTGAAPFAADATGVKSVDATVSGVLFGGTVYFMALHASAGFKLYVDETTTANYLLGNPSASIGATMGRGLRTSAGAFPIGTWPDMTSVSTYADSSYFFGSFKVA